MILRERCAERGIATRIDVTQASPEFSSRSAKASAERPRSRRRRSTRCELARVGDLATADGPNLGGFNGHDGRRVAIEHCELDLIGFSIVIHVDDGTDVA